MGTKTTLERLLPTAKLVFEAVNGTPGCKGIVMGGLAAALLGSERKTHDIDVNVTSFPNIDPLKLYARREACGSMMKATYMDPMQEDSIKCDIATRKAGLMPLFLKYCLTRDESGTSITYSKTELLLADKIRTYGERADKKNIKGGTDLEDIRFCMTEMFVQNEKMPEELKSLYTPEHLNQVVRNLALYEADGEWDIVAEEINIVHSN